MEDILTHKQIIDKLKSLLSKEQIESIVKINKSNSSGDNYINVIFSSEKDREEVEKTLWNETNTDFQCQKRYGIGLVINIYTIKALKR